MKRKEFINWAGIGLLASLFPVALAACSGEQSQEPAETTTTEPADTGVPDADGFVALGTVQELDSTGYLIDGQSNVIVFRNGTNSLAAVSLLCPHQGCPVDWQKSSNSLYCACHGSEFAADGKVTKGPAQSPLSNFEVKEENESVMVKVG